MNVPSAQRLVLHAVSWQEYQTLGDVFRERGGLRQTFDRGTLELRTTGFLHEWFKEVFGRLLETLAEEFEFALHPAGQMTFQREDLERGLEPDQCYWIANERRMRGHREWNPETDPPPDLVLEIEVSRSALNRMGIYAALGVPEVWRFDGEAIHVHHLQAGAYAVVPASPTFPGIPMNEMGRFLQPDAERDFLGIVRQFRQHVSQWRGIVG